MGYTVLIKVATMEELNRLTKAVQDVFPPPGSTDYDVDGECDDPDCKECVENAIEGLGAEGQEDLVEKHESHDDPHLNPECLLCKRYLKEH